MITSHRTIDKLLNNTNLGPNLKFENDALESYRKRLSQDSLSSKVSNKNQSQEKKVDQLPMIIQRLGRGRSARVLNGKSSENSPYKILQGQKNKNIANSLFKIIRINSLVDKFKNSLFSTAYILQTKEKTFYNLYEQNLLEGVGNSAQLFSQNESQILEKIITQIFLIITILKIRIDKEKYYQLVNLLKHQFVKYFFIWELYSLFMQLFKLWYCPFIISFGLSDHSLKGIEIFIVLYLFFDIFFSTIHYLIVDHENLVGVSKNFFKYQLIQKVISIAFWILIYYEFYKIAVFREIIAIIITTFILNSIQQKYEKQVERLFLKGFNLDYLELFTLLMTILLLAHYIGCIWHYIGEATYQLYGSWLEYHDLINQNIFNRYVYSFYWATTTIATVGYGDITPKNQIEIIFSTVVMLVSSCMFAYSINQIGLIVNGIYESNQKQKRSLALINSYMKKQNIDNQLQNRINNYIKFSSEKEIIENYEETQKLLNSLPPGLQNELKQNVRNNISKNIKIIQNLFSKPTNEQVSKTMIRLKVAPQDILYHKNDQNDRCLYFINSGEIKIVEENSKRILKILKAGESFGEYQFFTNQNTREAAISTQFSEVYKIDRESFLKIIKQNEKDFSIFNKIKDQILFKQDISILQQVCSTCQSKQHSYFDCPLTRIIPNIYMIVLKNNNNQENTRQHSLRNNFKFRTLLQFNNTNEVAYQFQDENNISQYSGQLETQNYSDNLEQNSFKQDDALRTQNKQASCTSLRRNKRQSSLKVKTHEQTLTILQKKKVTMYLEEQQQTKQNQIQITEINQLKILANTYFSNTMEDFDRLQTYADYFPQNNIQYVLKQVYLNKILKFSGKRLVRKIKKIGSHLIQ